MFGPRVAVAWMFHFQDDNLSRMTCEPAACRNAKVGACGSAKSGKTISSSQRGPSNRSEPERPQRDPLREDYNPPARPHPFNDPLAAAPRRPHPSGDFLPPDFEDPYDMTRPPRPMGGVGGFGNIGERDLYPAGLGPNDPIRGGIGPGFGGGGGMHPTFDDPLFQGQGGHRGGCIGSFEESIIGPVFRGSDCASMQIATEYNHPKLSLGLIPQANSASATASTSSCKPQAGKPSCFRRRHDNEVIGIAAHPPSLSKAAFAACNACLIGERETHASICQSVIGNMTYCGLQGSAAVERKSVTRAK
ncbi:hypothetical protein M8818_000891 [Zalaria obscura]|uniref:Uncharacterized protein n=1 Tax=Zalaria obscura TaxID=2024903 RepID=A0ACC3SLK8_9PEZI